ACEGHLQALRLESEQRRAHLAGFRFGARSADLRRRCGEVGGSWSIRHEAAFCRVGDGSWMFNFTNGRVDAISLLAEGAFLEALRGQFGPSVRRGDQETWIVSVGDRLWAIRYTRLPGAWAAHAFLAPEATTAELAARLDREAVAPPAAPRVEAAPSVDPTQYMVGTWRCTAASGSQYTEEYHRNGIYRLGRSAGTWAW